MKWACKSARVLNSKESLAGFLWTQPPLSSVNDPSLNLGPLLILADGDVYVNTVLFLLYMVSDCSVTLSDGLSRFHQSLPLHDDKNKNRMSLYCDVMSVMRQCHAVPVEYLFFFIQILNVNYEVQGRAKQLLFFPLKPWILFWPCSSSSLFSRLWFFWISLRVPRMSPFLLSCFLRFKGHRSLVSRQHTGTSVIGCEVQWKWRWGPVTLVYC